MKRRLLVLSAALLLLQAGKANAQAFTEGFNDITTLAGSGWYTQNNSTTIGSTGWFQGNPTVFASFAGATQAYIGANFNNTTNANTISNWLVAPNRTLRNGDVITFYTRCSPDNTYPDRLQVRMSTNGASTNVGTGSAAVGDFTTLLLEINPTQVTGVYPYLGWAQYTITISGLPAPTSGRFAFRYYVTNGGPLGTASDYIGIDEVVYTPYVCPAFTMTPSGALAGGTAGAAYNVSLTQTGALGAPNFAITAGALPPGLTMAANGTISGTPTATGTFNFTATVNDASGCSGAQSYSITIVCPLGGATFSSVPALCSNASLYTLTQGSPAGGTYSGTGVTGGQFNPAAGTQTLTYTLVDPYGCTQSANTSVTVNAAPTVTQSTITPVCSDAAIFTLTGGSPAGGSYSGTGVTAGQFDPAAGTQTVTYDYTDANGCSGSASQTVTVNAVPTVTLATFNPVCDNGGTVVLTGGSPAGGSYSGTNVSGGIFDPSAGAQTITYDYTDANGCSSSDAELFAVTPSPNVTFTSPGAVCDNAGNVVLTGGSPAGGTYSGTGVTGGSFDPAAGDQTLLYIFLDGNGCSDSSTAQITVSQAPTASFQASSSSLCTSDGNVTLTGTPAGGTFSGTGVAGTTFNPSTAGVGTHTVTYIYTEPGTGCSDTATSSIEVYGCAGLQGTENAMAFSIFPNPADEVITLSATVADMSSPVTIRIYSIDGKLVASSQVAPSQDQLTLPIDISSFDAGVYLMNVTNGKHFNTERFIKK